jgi:hypothetical protein
MRGAPWRSAGGSTAPDVAPMPAPTIWSNMLAGRDVGYQRQTGKRLLSLSLSC